MKLSVNTVVPVVIQAPTECAGVAVRQAVKQWRFKPYHLANGRAVLWSGLLTFYFEIRNGKGVVLNPNDAGYIGHWPMTSASPEKLHYAKRRPSLGQ